MRTRLMFVALAAVAGWLPAHAESRLGSTQGAARLDFRIVIPTVLQVHAMTQPASLEVTEQHVGQGYVEVTEGSRVRLFSNGRRGYQLSVAFDSSLVARVVVRTPLREFTVEASGAAADVPTPTYGEQEVPVSYRIYLKDGARPGSHRFPVGLAFSAIAS